MIYLSRSKNGHLILSQKKPSHWSAKRGSKREFLKDVWNSGQEFYLKCEILGAEEIPSEDSEGNRYVLGADLQLVEDDDERWVNPLWITRGTDGRLMLHYGEEPTRMRDSAEYKMRKNWKYSIKKNGRKWTSWKGHFRVPAFIGAGSIYFDDERPRKVIVIIPEKIDMPWSKYFKALEKSDKYYIPREIENKVEKVIS